MSRNASTLHSEGYVSPAAKIVAMTSDASFLFPTSGTNEEYNSPEDYGGEWI